MSEQNRLNGGKASDWLRPYTPNWALFVIAGGVRLAIIELRQTRQLRAVSAPCFVHTGGKSEAQLTKKQAVLLMHNIYAHLDNVLVHMIDDQEAAIFKSKQDFNKNKEKISQYIKYAENWQVMSVICSYTAMACDVLLIVAMIVFLLKYCKTMQAMLTAFLQMNTKNTGIQSVQADQIGRTYPPLFILNLPKEEEIIDDLREITAMEYVVQVIMIIVCIAVVIIVMYFCCTKCRHTHNIFKYCFPFFLISCIICTA